MIATWRGSCTQTPTRRTIVIGASSSHGATSSQRNMKATAARSRRGGSEWCSHASAVGRHVEAKWYSSAVRRFQVGQSAVTFTVPDMSMNLTHCARRTHVMGCATAAASSACNEVHGA
jgi:hypothetical protein